MALTAEGLRVQILGVLRSWHEHPERCSNNDCKFLLGQALRIYAAPMRKAGSLKYLQSTAAAAEPARRPVKDHAIPVIYLQDALMKWAPEETNWSPGVDEKLARFLNDQLILVRILPEQDVKLTKLGLRQRMPPEWSNPDHHWYSDPLARYHSAGIAIAESSNTPPRAPKKRTSIAR
jgi:hypothetical protein